MSRSQKPRTVRYFPKMKVRGLDRRRQVDWELMLRGWDQMGIAVKEAQRQIERFGIEFSAEVGTGVQKLVKHG